ncbi:hypothetical protein [Anaplasma platys]|uniref:hypothetical protein n=1 Tax=Anaplasma platys TaxID=949 RepID=UPI00145EFACF|nr:hypothetical protein [Anaplasma platys]
MIVIVVDYFKQLVASSVQRNATHLYCTADKSPAIKKMGRLEFLQVRKSSAQDLQDIADGLLNKEQKSRLDSNGHILIRTGFDSLHRLHIRIVKDASISEITTIIEEINTQSRADLPPALIQAVSCTQSGMLLLGGAHHHNKQLTIRCLLAEVCALQRKTVLTFGVHDLQNSVLENTIISSYSLEQMNVNLVRFQAADIVIFGDVSPEVMAIAHDCVMLGMLVIIAVDASNIPNTVTRTISMFPDSDTGKKFLATCLIAVAFQVIITTKVNCSNLYLYDFVPCSDTLRQKIDDGQEWLAGSTEIVDKMNKLIENGELAYYDVHPILAALTDTVTKCGEDKDTF